MKYDSRLTDLTLPSLVLLTLGACSGPDQDAPPAAAGDAAMPGGPPPTPAATAASTTPLPAVTYIKASSVGVADQFGSGGAVWGQSLALSGDGTTLAAGSRLEDSAATGIGGDETDDSARDAGAVYVFTKDGNRWQQQAYVKASNTDAGDQFGFNVVLSDDGNTMAVSAPTEDSAATGIDGDQADDSYTTAGAVYVFTRSGGTWSQQAYVKASNTGEAEDGDTFGYTLAISGDGNTLAVGAIGEDSAATGVNGDETNNDAPGSGAVYVFTRNGGAWSQQAYIKASNPDISDLFSSSIALDDSGDTLAVGALDEDSAARGVNGDQSDNSAAGSGAVYVFTRDGATWSQHAYIKSSNSEPNDAFGNDVALSADGLTLAVGALDEDSMLTGVMLPDSNVGGTDHEDDLSSGAVYVFTRSGDTWAEQAYIKPSNTGVHDQFGTRVELSHDGSALAVATPLEDGSSRTINGMQDDGAEDGGAVYFFLRENGGWGQAAYIKSQNLDPYDEFGSTVALNADGTMLATGARGEDGGATGINGDQSDNSVRDAGAVYVFENFLR